MPTIDSVMGMTNNHGENPGRICSHSLYLVGKEMTDGSELMPKEWELATDPHGDCQILRCMCNG